MMYSIVNNIREEKEQNAVILTSDLYDSAIKLTDRKIIEEYYKLKENGCESIATELQQGLHELGMLMDHEEFHKVISEINERLNKKLLLTIMPTEGCNFRCVYCYEDHKPKTMGREQVDAVKKFLKREAEHYEYIQLSWFGGEPTLCREIVLEVNHLVQKLTEKTPEKFMSGMTTNGYLLDLESFEKYYESGITSYQITLDGWKHDEKRPLGSGEGSLKKIIENLDAIHGLPEEYQFQILLRYNILPGDEDFTWYDYLNEKYGDDTRFSIFIHTVDDMGGDGVKDLQLLNGEERKKSINRHLEYISNLKIKAENDSMSHRTKLGGDICYAAHKNHFTIRADGRIVKCTVALDAPDNQIGYLDLEGKMQINEEINRKWYDIRLSKNCYSCKEVFSCMNKRCPLRRVENSEYQCEDVE